MTLSSEHLYDYLLLSTIVHHYGEGSLVKLTNRSFAFSQIHLAPCWVHHFTYSFKIHILIPFCLRTSLESTTFEIFWQRFIVHMLTFVILRIQIYDLTVSPRFYMITWKQKLFWSRLKCKWVFPKECVSSNTMNVSFRNY